MNKYVFLDIDEVLNGKGWYERRGPYPEGCSNEEHYRFQIDPVALELVNYLCEQTDAKVVISSTWRRNMNRVLWGFDNRHRFVICGATPCHDDGVRGHEIQVWMDKFGIKPEQIVILDDGSDMEHLLPRLVQINQNTGITIKDVEEAIKLLENGNSCDDAKHLC